MINIKYQSTQDENKIEKIKESEDINTNTKTFSFLLDNYFSNKIEIQNLKSTIIRLRLKNQSSIF
jgi:hypothetical protein